MLGKVGFVVAVFAAVTVSIPHQLGQNWANFQPIPYPGPQFGNGFGPGQLPFPFPLWPQIPQPNPLIPEQPEQNPGPQEQPSNLEDFPFVVPEARQLNLFAGIPACDLSGAPTTMAAITKVPLFCLLFGR